MFKISAGWLSIVVLSRVTFPKVPRTENTVILGTDFPDITKNVPIRSLVEGTVNKKDSQQSATYNLLGKSSF